MSRPTISERARMYVAAMPPAISGSGGHNATFAAACALVKGFHLSVDQAMPMMEDFNGRCDVKWSAKELEHKLRSADGSPDDQDRGYLIGQGYDGKGVAEPVGGRRAVVAPVPKPVYDPAALREFAGDWAREVDLVWLANRSEVDPATLDTEGFLSTLYDATNEKVLVFTEEYTQGQAMWPDDPVPETGKCGVWFLGQPVDGDYHPNPRQGTRSRRSEESVTAWRWMVLESDDAPVREWLGAVAQLPLKIGAIYSSGGRSVHALVQVDAKTKRHWDDIKAAMAPGLRFLITNGADSGVLTAVRLTRLPGCFREGKMSKGKEHVRFAKPVLQKLLYINSKPEARPLIEQFARRDVVNWWCDVGVADSDPTGGEWIKEGLRYYATVSEVAKKRLAELEGGLS
ncbi:MAG: hypothetical protein QM496_02025 [Verrucomicrobiota bacterium]